MKVVKGSYFSGYVQILVDGQHPEHFLQTCAINGVMLWNINKVNNNQCTAMIRLQDVKEVRRLRFGSTYKIRFKRKHGIPFLKKRVKKRRPLLIGLLLSVLLFFFLSNIIWQVNVTGVPEELENKIYDRLTSYGVYPGAFSFQVDSPNQIQQLLLEDIPELLWVGVDQKGTSYYLEGVEKLIIKDEELKSPRHLVAEKSGVIKSMYVKKGLPQVKVNDFVEEGQVLVSGAIEKRVQEDEEEAFEFLVSEGEIIATTWYQADVVVPLNMEHVELTGNNEERYSIGIGSFSVPIWPWRKEEYTDEIVEIDERRFELFGFKFPIYMIEEKRYESISKLTERTQEEAIQAGVKQVKKDLQRELGTEAKIITEKVLHETIRHGKVELSLYITVEENIAIEQPINQGD